MTTESYILFEEQRSFKRKTDYNIFFTEVSDFISRVKTIQKLKPELTFNYLIDKCSPEYVISFFKNVSKPEENHGSRKSSLHHEEIQSLFRRIFLKKFLIIGVLRLFANLLLFTGPVFQDLLTNNLKEYQKEHGHENGDLDKKVENLLYSVALLAGFLLFTFFDTRYTWNLGKLDVEGKIALQHLLYQKALKIKVMTDQENPDASKDVEKQHKLNFNNLLSVDVNQVLNFIQSFHQTWTQILNLIIGLCLLFYKMQEAVIIGFVAVSLLILLNFYIAKKIGTYYDRMMKCKDRRINLTHDILLGMRQIKYLNWEKIFEEKLKKIREEEYKALKIIKYLDAFCVFFWATTTIVISCSTFIAFDFLGNNLGNVNIFTVITLFNLLIFPLNALPWTIGGMLMGKVSLKRMNEFLSLPEVDLSHQDKGTYDDSDHNQLFSSSELQNESIQNKDFPTVEKVHVHKDELYALKINKMNYKWPIYPKKADHKPHDEKPEDLAFISNNQPFSRFHLNIFNFKIKKNTLTFFVGSVGCGKSAIFNAILSEMDFVDCEVHKSGRISIDSQISALMDKMVINGSIAYVPPNSWLQNKSIKDNILFGKPMNQDLYEECIAACCLIPDILSFKAKDLYEVGVDGNNISGGQRQRIALCRALYQDKDIYLLDDIFTSVDPEVANHIFRSAIWEFLLRRKKTVLLIASQHNFITATMGLPDVSVYLVKDGTLTNDPEMLATFLQSDQQPSSFTHFSIDQVKSIDKLSLLKSIRSVDQDRKSARVILKGEEIDTSLLTLKAGDSSEEKIDEPRSSYASIFQKDNLEEEKNEEMREEGDIKFSTFETYIKGMGWFIFLTIILSMVFMQFMRNFFDIWLKYYASGSALFVIENLVITLAIIAAISIIVTLFRAFIFAAGNLHAAKNVFRRLLTRVIYSKIQFFETNPIGRILNRFSADTAMVDDRLPFEFNILLNNILNVMGSLLIICVQIPYIAISVLIIGIFFYSIQSKYRKTSRELKRLDSVNYSLFLSHVSETLTGIKVIRAHKKETFFYNTFLEKMRAVIATNFLLNGISCWLSFRLQLLSSFITFSILLVSHIFIWVGHEDDVNSFALSLSYAFSITSLLRDLIMSITSTERELIGVERIQHYLNNEVENLERTDQHKADEFTTERGLSLLRIEHNTSSYMIEFKNVDLRYNNKFNLDSKLALEKVSFGINRNEKVAFVGRTGSGKTSILNALFGLYNTEGGDIFVEGVNINTLALKILRQKISVVPQSGFLFSGTVKENLDPVNKFDYDYIEHIIAQTKLSVLKERASQDLGLLSNNFLSENFEIEKSGANLSNGEKQILSFIRILLKNNEIICLDEATSNLDPYTDEIINEVIKQFSNKTIILITHRVANLKYFDCIYVMHKGRIVESGKFEELKNNKDGYFNNLVEHAENANKISNI